MLRGALAGEEASARAVNAEPWEPLRGMVKQQCPWCRYWFAATCKQPGAALPGLRGQAVARPEEISVKTSMTMRRCAWLMPCKGN